MRQIGGHLPDFLGVSAISAGTARAGTLRLSGGARSAARALRRDKRVTGGGIARGLRSVSDASPEVAVSPANWNTIIDALGGGGSVNLGGASGSLDYDDPR